MTLESTADLLVLYAAAMTLVWAAVSDVTRFTIPNAAVLALAALFLPFAVMAMTPLAILAHAGVALLAFAIGAGLFAMKIMGGGDAKLIAAVGLWAGPALALQTLLLMALAGGVMALGMIVYSALRMRLSFVGMVAPGTAIKSQPLPYGLAIAAAGLWMLHSLASA